MDIDIAKPFNPYEPRARRRTNVDRYEPNQGNPTAEPKSPRTKRSQKRLSVMKRNSSRVDKKFHARNVKSGRLTLTSNANLGIFKKGRTSEPIGCPQGSYLNFSEINFLGRAVPPSASPEATLSGFENSPKQFPKKYLSDTPIEKKLFESLADCRQLSVPYEEYIPITSNSQFLSVDDLKVLYSKRNIIQDEGTCKNVYDYTRNTRIFPENPAYNREESRYALSQIHAPSLTTEKLEVGKEASFDQFLESVRDFDENVALELLAELLTSEDPGADNSKPAQPARPAVLHACPVQRHRNSTETYLESTNMCSANLGVTQEQYESIDHPQSREYIDRETITGDYTVHMPTGFDAYKLGRRASPSARMTNQLSMRTSLRPASQHAASEVASYRRFWRCNKLY